MTSRPLPGPQQEATRKCPIPVTGSITINKYIYNVYLILSVLTEVHVSNICDCMKVSLYLVVFHPREVVFQGKHIRKM